MDVSFLVFEIIWLSADREYQHALKMGVGK